MDGVPFNVVNIIISLLTALSAAGMTIGIGGWWLRSQFSNSGRVYAEKLDAGIEKILAKLEYHERHDDTRFANMNQDINLRMTAVNNEIWAIKLRNAQRDKEIIAELIPHA